MTQPPGDLLADLAAAGDPQKLRPHLTDERAVVRSAAVAALARIGTPEAHAVLDEALLELDRWTRLEIVRAVGALPNVALDPDAEIRLEAIRSAPADARFLDDPDPNLRRRVWRALADRADVIARGLRDPVLRAQAEKRLLELPLSDSLPAVGDDPFRAVLIERLKTLPPPDRCEILRPLLEHDWAVDLYPHRRELFTHPSAAVRRRVMTDDPMRFIHDPSIAQEAALALAKQGCTDPALIEPYHALLAADVDVVDLLIAMEGLDRLPRTGPRRVLRRIARALADARRFDDLAALADSDDEVVLRICAETLPDDRAIIPLILLGATERLKPLPAEFLIAALGHRRLEVQRYAAEALQSHDDPRMVEPLLRAADSESPAVQEAVVRALARFAHEPRVASRLIDFLSYGEMPVRQTACEVLGEARVHEAVEPLTRVLVNQFLRKRAEAALRKIGDRRGMLSVLRRKLRDAAVEKARAWVQQRNEKRQKIRTQVAHG